MKQVIVDFGKVNLFGHPVELRIYAYGLMLVFGFIFGTYLARWRAKRFGENPEVITSMGLLGLIGGVIGARGAFVIANWNTDFAWRENPLREAINVTAGGLIYYGGVALGLLLVFGYMWLRHLPLRRYLDIVAPSIMLGLAFGRAGCTLNGCCFGSRCREDFPLAMRFPYASTPLILLDKDANVFGGASVSPAFQHQVNLPPEKGGIDIKSLPDWLFKHDAEGHILRDAEGKIVLKSPSELTAEQARQALKLTALPVQPAEPFGIVNALIIMFILLGFSRLRSREGTVFALLLILYPITRFVLESIRGDNPHNLLRFQFTHNQYTSMVLVILGLVIWRVLWRLPSSAGPFWYERVELARQRRMVSSKQRRKKR
mgnify:CR=1 FL=1